MSNTKAARRPDNQPFNFNLDAVRYEADLTPFTVQWSGSRWEFAHVQSLSVWDLLEAAEGGDVEAMIGVFRTALGDEQWKRFRAVPLAQYQLQALFTAYQEHCGMAPGESPASDGS
ncbi:hypothetical protein [Kitasatospora sp. NPDC005748]|uniref:hypothetical protein n=1 Tax=Kitasatospora sp. NPDC005748 TaxID=3157063 RepID=UPI0033D4A4C5